MKEVYIPSTDGKNKLHVVIWEPNIQVIGVVQISHGMVEYIKRYDEFARYLNQYGILVVGNDHLGHGETAKTDDDWGYFCSDNMSETVVEDLYKITCFATVSYTHLYLLSNSLSHIVSKSVGAGCEVVT